MMDKPEIQKTFIRDKLDCDKLGIPAYIWRTCKDQRVRKSHSNLDDVIVFWNEPPDAEELVGEESSLGESHAGEYNGCRCYGEPIIRLEFVKWPHKVYYKGKIQNMTEEEFEIIFKK